MQRIEIAGTMITTTFEPRFESKEDGAIMALAGRNNQDKPSDSWHEIVHK